MRLLIGACLIVLLVLPFAFGEPRFEVPPPAYVEVKSGLYVPALPMLPGGASQLFDIAKTLVGVFIGAGLAFATNEMVQRRSRARDDKAAGNVALATIGRAYSDFLRVRQ